MFYEVKVVGVGGKVSSIIFDTKEEADKEIQFQKKIKKRGEKIEFHIWGRSC